MSWITIAGKTLEFSGKIIQSASFEAWAESKGQEIIEKTAQQRTIAWFGKKRAARKVLWDDLKLVTQKPALHAVLSRLASNYLTTIATVANAFQDNEFIADGNTYVIPRLAVNPLHRALLERTLSTSDEFLGLKGGPLLQSYFYDEFVEQLDAAFVEMKPSPDSAIRMEQTYWYVVGMTDRYDWRIKAEKWQGHFFVHGSMSDLTERRTRKMWETKVKEQISSLDEKMGRFSREQKQELAEPWIKMRDSLIAGQKVNDVPTLIAED